MRKLSIFILSLLLFAGSLAHGADLQPRLTEAGVDHVNIQSIGTNAHSVVDTHLASTSDPHSVTAAQVGLGNVENTALSTWAGSSNITTLGTITSALVVNTTDGIDLGDGTDADQTLLTVDILSTSPTLIWDESEDLFNFSEGILVIAEVGVGGTIRYQDESSGNYIEMWHGNSSGVFQTNGTFYSLIINGLNNMTLRNNGRTAFSTTITSPLAKVDIEQESTTAAIAVLRLIQDDVSEPFANFVGTATADANSSISTLNTSGATTDHIQIDLNGTKAWVAVSTNNPS